MDKLPTSPSVVIFDVNETLLDLKPLKDSVDKILPAGGGSTLWFTTTLQYSLVMTVSGQHAPFHDIGVAVLKMLKENPDGVLVDNDAKAALRPLLSLPAHQDVKPGLERLREAGFRLATLTNSTAAGVKTQLDHAGLADFFERQLSVEAVGKYKPHVDVYRWAANQMGVEIGECMLVAAHGWDVAGAAWAGMQSAFIARPSQQMFPLSPPADVVVAGLDSLAERLVATRSRPA